ncbi:PorV/PorQ family protein [Chloroherpeton thalassium]|nr:PorV/PorQ family protein [Chloroherpeton thalassium]
MPFSTQASAGLDFLKIVPSAREQALAGVGVASSSGAAATYFNPALMQNRGISGALFSQNFWFMDTYASYAATNFNGEKSAVGISLYWLSVRDIPVRSSPTAEPDGYFNSQNAAISLSYSRKMSERLTLSLTGKMLYEKIYINDATGFAGDISAAWRLPESPLSFGAALQNMGSMGKLLSESSELPTSFRLGAAYAFLLDGKGKENTLLLELNHVSVFSDDSYQALGVEYAFREFLWMRLGYLLGNDSRSVSFGFGVKYENFLFDYAYVPFTNELGSANVLTLQFLY